MVLAIVMLVFLGFALAISWRPASIIALAFSVYGFEQWAQANSAFFGQHASFINFGFGILAVWAVCCLAFRGDNPLNPATGAMWTWLALYVYAGISVMWSLDRDISMFLFKYHAPYMLTFAGLVPLVVVRADDLYKSLIATLLFGTFVMVLLLVSTRVHSYGRTITAAQGVVNRVGQSQTRLSPLAIAEMAGEILILAMLMNFRGVQRIWQTARWPVCMLGLALIYRSGSRGQLIGVLLAIIMLITFSRGMKKAVGWVAAAVTTMMIIGFTIWSFIGYADHRGRWDVDKMQSQFASTRIEFVSNLLGYWLQSGPVAWLFGLGNSASYDQRVNGIYCHVLVCEMIGELGLVGFTLFVTFFVFVGRDIVQAYQLVKDDDKERGVLVAMTGVFVYLVILSFKQGSFLTHNFTFCAGLIISRYAAVMRDAYQKHRVRELQRRWYEYYARMGSPAYQAPSGS